MSAYHCAIVGCSNGGYRLMKWKQKECEVHKVLHESNECDCDPPFSLWPIPTRKTRPEQRDKWKILINRTQPGTKFSRLLSPSKDQRVCSVHFKDGQPTKANPYPTERLGYPDYHTKVAQVLGDRDETCPSPPKLQQMKKPTSSPSCGLSEEKRLIADGAQNQPGLNSSSVAEVKKEKEEACHSPSQVGQQTQSAKRPSSSLSNGPSGEKRQKPNGLIKHSGLKLPQMASAKRPALGLSLFTVQQIELIRRLRNSGLTKEQVVIAYESLEQTDAELGNMYTVPVSLAQQNSGVLSRTAPQPAQPGNQQPVFPETVQCPVNLPNTTSMPTTPAVAAPAPIGQPPSAAVPLTTLPQSTNAGSAATVTHVNRRFPNARRLPEVKLEPKDTFEEEGADTAPSAPSSALTSEINSLGLDTFLKKGTEKMHEEIREFLFAHPALVNDDIAEAAGVEVTSVNQFLIGNFPAIAPVALYRLCQWFLTTRTQYYQQHGSLPAPSSEAGSGAVPMEHQGPSEPEGLAVNFTPRRERFTFRTQHLEVLEAYFKTNQYPTFEERSDIAHRCNESVAFGRTLGEKEKMTPQNVAYWFSNRRKDIKRMAREGGIEMSSVVLPSKVRHPTPTFTMLNKDTAVLNVTCNPQTPFTTTCPPTGLNGGAAMLPGLPQSLPAMTPSLAAMPHSLPAQSLAAMTQSSLVSQSLPGMSQSLPGMTQSFAAQSVPGMSQTLPTMPQSVPPMPQSSPAVPQTSSSETATPQECSNAASFGTEQSVSSAPEIADHKPPLPILNVSTNGSGSVVDRIASAITSHLMGRSGDMETPPVVDTPVTDAPTDGV